MENHCREETKKTSNWAAEIEVPLGMKYVLSSNISKYRRFFWTGNAQILTSGLFN